MTEHVKISLSPYPGGEPARFICGVHDKELIRSNNGFEFFCPVDGCHQSLFVEEIATVAQWLIGKI